MDDIKLLQKQNLVDAVQNEIISRIAAHKWKPNDQLPSENELAAAFGVSRFTVRTALQRLIAWGLLDAQNGKGTFVSAPNASIVTNPLLAYFTLNSVDMVDLLQFRRGIEFVSCELAAINGTDAEIQDLGDCVTLLDEASQRNDVAAFIKNDIDFHIIISKMSRNPAIISVMEMLRTVLEEHFNKTARIFDLKESIKYHRSVYQAIQDHNPKEASDVMQRFISLSIELAKK